MVSAVPIVIFSDFFNNVHAHEILDQGFLIASTGHFTYKKKGVRIFDILNYSIRIRNR
jgi:hypothetical protein